MAKKNSTAKDTELSLSFLGKVAALFRSETVHFVIGLVLVIFSVYLLLAFTSFFSRERQTRASLTEAVRRS